MSEYNVTISALANKADELQNLNVQFKTKVGELVELENSLNNMWEGGARIEFHNAFARDVEQMGNFYNAVNKYVETLCQDAKRYQDAENQNIEIGKTRTYGG